jgi:integrase
MTAFKPDLNFEQSVKAGAASCRPALTASDLVSWLARQDIDDVRRRDQISAVNRICAMGGVSPAHFVVTASSVRSLLASIKPAAQGVSSKTFSNIVSNLTAALVAVGIIDGNLRGLAGKDPSWSTLRHALEDNDALSNGLARFMNHCAWRGIQPEAVADAVVVEYRVWLEGRTLVASPREHARRVPDLWNRAAAKIAGWPRTTLSALPVEGKPRKIAWDALPKAFRLEAEAYLAMRRNPDPFDERSDRPTRPLADATLHQQREHIRLSFDVLANAGDAPASLAGLVEPERLKTVLRHYHDGANGKPNAFAVSLGKTVVAIAKYHVRVTPEDLSRLKQIAGKLPSIPFDLTEKNKDLIRQFDDKTVLARLLTLPYLLVQEARDRLETGRPHVQLPAQVALAIAILFAAPMRCQNLIALNWRDHIREPNGRRGPVSILIPASQTKTRRLDLAFELDRNTSDLLRWYRLVILPALGADPKGDLFVQPGGKRRGRSGLSSQITEAIHRHVGVHMTPHQFRHLAAALYLDARPEDFETVRQILGHSYGKTTLIYAGLSSERASKAFGLIVAAERERLRTIAAKPRKGPRSTPKPPKT